MKNGYVLIELLVSLVLLGIATQISLTYLFTYQRSESKTLVTIDSKKPPSTRAI